MPNIDIDFVSVPDSIQPIPDGQYEFTIDQADVVPTKDEKGTKIVAKLTVASGEFAGRTIFDHLGLSNDMGKIQVKKLLKAAGIPVSASGFDTADLIGRRVRATVTKRSYQDAGVIKETNNIKEYLAA